MEGPGTLGAMSALLWHCGGVQKRHRRLHNSANVEVQGAEGAPRRGTWSRLGRVLSGCWGFGSTLRGGSVNSMY